MLVRMYPVHEVAEHVVRLLNAFGDATINEAVERGKAGEPTFFARERAHRWYEVD